MNTKTADVEIVKYSIGPNGVRMYTVLASYPRMVHSEVMTHRVASKSAASSRAIPTLTAIANTLMNPAVPAYWGKNRPGMAATEELVGEELEAAKQWWKELRDHVALQVEKAHKEFGLHKQLVTRPLEPFSNIRTLITFTESSNMFALRDHHAAQPEFQALMRATKEALRETRPQELFQGEWHLPFVDDKDKTEMDDFIDGHPHLKTLDYSIAKIPFSVVRCARGSYDRFGEGKSYQDDLSRFLDLVVQGHMGPLEHQGYSMTEEDWTSYGTKAAMKWVTDRVPMGNLWGWGQFRKEIEGEHDFRLLRNLEKPTEDDAVNELVAHILKQVRPVGMRTSGPEGIIEWEAAEFDKS